MGMQWDVLNIKRDVMKYRDILINRGATYMIISMISNTCIHQDRIRDGQLKITLGQPGSARYGPGRKFRMKQL